MPIYLRRCAKCHGLLSEEDTVICPHCGTSLIDTGVEIEQTNKCPECGEPLKRGDAYCSKCGKRYPQRRAEYTEP